MPYDSPTLSTVNPVWLCAVTYGTTPTVRVIVSITVADGAPESEADAALQDVTNIFSNRSSYSGVIATKTYEADTTQVMEPSV